MPRVPHGHGRYAAGDSSISPRRIRGAHLPPAAIGPIPPLLDATLRRSVLFGSSVFAYSGLSGYIARLCKQLFPGNRARCRCHRTCEAGFFCPQVFYTTAEPRALRANPAALFAVAPSHGLAIGGRRLRVRSAGTTCPARPLG